MRLLSLNYSQFDGQPLEWRLEGLELRRINLLVGSNASGKSRTLNVIAGLAKLVSGEMKVNVLSSNWDAVFTHEGKTFRYRLEVDDQIVKREEFSIDKRVLLERGNKGEGKIWAEKLQTTIDFQAPQDEIAAASRRDSIQHPFFDALHVWGRSLFHYHFGTSLGKERLGRIVDAPIPIDPRDENQVIAIYRRGEKDFGPAFKESIKRDMASVDYLIDDVGAKKPISVRFDGASQDLVAMYVKETALNEVTDQIDMSQGMFRVLSIIIQLNYSELSQTPSCILFDDIGEGLDFDRSCALIKLLMQKAEKSSVQLIMSSNDRFVMNAVPLEAWTLLRRVGNKINIYNYSNSKERFDEFKFTGLNNFDFFALDFVDKIPDAR